MDKDTLHEVDLHIFQMIIDFASYAGNAFLSNDEEMMNQFKGQYIGLMRLHKWLEEKSLRLYQAEEKEKEEQCKYRCAHGHKFNTPSMQPDIDEEMYRCSICGCPDFGMVKEDTSAEYVKEQMLTLNAFDHDLFTDMVEGLKYKGWVEDGGSPTFRLLHNADAAIKIFRHADSPAVIKVCFSAEPEEPTPPPCTDENEGDVTPENE